MQSGKRFVLSLHYNGSNSFFFVNATKVNQFKANKGLCTVFRLSFKRFYNKQYEKTGLRVVVNFFLLILIWLILTVF